VSAEPPAELTALVEELRELSQQCEAGDFGQTDDLETWTAWAADVARRAVEHLSTPCASCQARQGRDRLAEVIAGIEARTAALPPDSWERIANENDKLIDQLWKAVGTDAGQSGNDSIVDAVAGYKRRAEADEAELARLKAEGPAKDARVG
jgi:hypothetical protein